MALIASLHPQGIDEQIQDAIRKGQFADLPGTGKPLKLDEDSHTPEHLRMAHKILRDNDLVPDWIAEGQELDDARARLIEDIRRVARAQQGSAALEALRAAAQKYNGQVLSYNLKVPKGITHKRHLDFKREVQMSR